MCTYDCNKKRATSASVFNPWLVRSSRHSVNAGPIFTDVECLARSLALFFSLASSDSGLFAATFGFFAGSAITLTIIYSNKL